MRIRLLSLIAIICAVLSISFDVRAAEWKGLGPISIRNQNPLSLQFAALSPQRAATLKKGEANMKIDSSYSNIYEQGTNGTQTLDLDMEYWRSAWSLNYGLDDKLEVGIEIPVVHYSGGFMDGFIQKYHNTFGFPNGGRDLVANDRFAYGFSDAGADRLGFPPMTFGLGDITIRTKRAILDGDRALKVSLFSDFKFPTGEEGRGAGSGTPDFGMGLILDYTHWRLHGYVNGAYYMLGGNERLDPYVRDSMWAFSAAQELSILPNFSAIVELNGSTPIFEGTGIDEMDGTPLDLIIGFRGESSDKQGGGRDIFWEFGFSEDVTSVGPSVDFTVFLSLGMKLGNN